MALEFRQRRFHKPGKKGQLAISIAALLLAIGVAAVWMTVYFREDPQSGESDPNSTPIDHSFSTADTANLLVIFQEDERESFFLMQSDPDDVAIRIAAIPENLTVNDDRTLSEAFRKDGAVAATAAVNSTLQLTVNHYISCDTENAEAWFERLDGGITVTLNAPLDLTDASGRVTSLEAGENLLTAPQAVAMLAVPEQAITLLTAMINQHLTADRYLSGDFTQVSNQMKTSLRIGDFNDYHAALQHIAAANDGNICEAVTLYGDADNGRWLFGYEETRSHTPLFDK